MSKHQRSRSLSPSVYSYSVDASVHGTIDDTHKQLPYGHLARYAEDKHVAMRMRQIAANRRANSVSPHERDGNDTTTLRHPDLRAALYSLLQSSLYKHDVAARYWDPAIAHRYNSPSQETKALCHNVITRQPNNTNDGTAASATAPENVTNSSKGYVHLLPLPPRASIHRQGHLVDTSDSKSPMQAQNLHHGDVRSSARAASMTTALAHKGQPNIKTSQVRSSDNKTTPQHRTLADEAAEAQQQGIARRQPHCATTVLPSKEKVTLSISSPSGRQAGAIEYPTTWTNPMVMDGSLTDTSGSSTKDALYILRHTQRALQDTLSELQTARQDLGRAARQHARGQQHEHKQKSITVQPARCSPRQQAKIDQLQAYLQQTKEREQNARRQALQLIAENLELVSQLEAIQRANQGRENASSEQSHPGTAVQTKTGITALCARPTGSLNLDKAANMVETPMEACSRLLCMHDSEAQTTVLAHTTAGDSKPRNTTAGNTAGRMHMQLDQQSECTRGHGDCLLQPAQQRLKERQSVSLLPHAASAMRTRYHEPHSPEHIHSQVDSPGRVNSEMPAFEVRDVLVTDRKTTADDGHETFEQHHLQERSYDRQYTISTRTGHPSQSSKKIPHLIQGQAGVAACKHQSPEQETANVTCSSKPQCIGLTVPQDAKSQDACHGNEPLGKKPGAWNDTTGRAFASIDTCHVNTAVQAASSRSDARECMPTSIHDGHFNIGFIRTLFRHNATLFTSAALSCATAFFMYQGLLTAYRSRRVTKKHRHGQRRCCADLGGLHK